jgi:pimeloyl-ACP methyl ester carboxylesterase
MESTMNEKLETKGDNRMNTVTSKDGTAIAYERLGQGQPIILVASALSDRSDAARLAELLAERFTVINYDRRGRGASGDTAPYAVEREVEDIEALIDTAGGSAFVFGSSSGAILALEAATKLPTKINKQVLYEPPLIIDDSRPPVPDDLGGQVNRLISEKRRDQALRLFLTKGMGIPGLFVALMRFMPDWSKMKAMAHTVPYDLAITGDTLAGKPLPAGRWASAKMPTLVLTGEKSEAFFHKGAQALASSLPNAQHRILKGQNHGAVVMGAKTLGPILIEFFEA